ncbi:Hypothetical predicted protein [Xyrichtys novacula]|nr:Hypothetical predicted protein [Xyrichtys novacula]
MKLFLALVFLLHLCAGQKTNITLNKEILRSLRRLDGLWKDDKLSLTTDTVRVPSVSMINNATSCVSVFVSELKSLLGNVTVHKDHKHILKELRGNLDLLKSRSKNDSRCQMRELMEDESPFQPYQDFIRKLSSMPHAA